MTVKELYGYLDAKIPRSLSCEWDNDGLMCCPEPQKEVKRVLVALDISEEIVDRAIAEEYDVILSHHPLVFRPVKSLTDEAGVPRKLIRLVQNGITAMSFHTRFDALEGGVNDVLAGLLGLANVTKFGECGELMGRIGDVEPTTLDEFAEKVKKALGSPVVLYNGSRAVSRIALLGGNGDDFVGAAIAAGADTYVSGRIGYHMMADAKENGINLIEAGHYFTEAPALDKLAQMVKEILPDADVAIIGSNSINVR